MATKTKEGQYVRITDNGVADARRFHIYLDCSTLKGHVGDEDIENLNDREVQLLGVKVCSVCERRKTGGPAIDALKEILWPIISEAGTSEDWQADDAENAAWKVMNELKDRGFYIAKRTNKTTENGDSPATE